ncbi:MAG: DUF4233 domain-containing protein [Actinobacteria bacterium]|uniref:Unannotated protein n=1 Tax=freshwater metagenome TaxID=449393 RepID=A0A6J7DIA7_9ZZZZ|nr:DUF4233 domain-containing protein [Actinomycetota bacterium]MSY67310.1 DUF4233 domain-containing protein [Actinomycetota bacterium]
MRILGATVLVMEGLTLSFGLLLAMSSVSSADAIWLWAGGALALLLILTAGLLKRKSGWIIGSILQVGVVAYGFVVTAMFAMGALYTGLWIAAIVVGRKGEAARARLSGR